MKKLFWLVGAMAVAGLVAACSDDNGTGNDDTTPPDTIRALSMTAGAWWVEHSYDTTKEVSRSSSTTGVTTTTTLGEHHTRYRLTITWTVPDTTYFAYEITDTAFVDGVQDTVSVDTTWIFVVDGKVREYPGNMGSLNMSDTLMLTSYQSPMTVGSSWEALSATVDSAIYFDLGDWYAALAGQTAKVRIHSSGTGTGSVERMLKYALGGVQHDCFEIVTDLSAPFTITVDSTISVNVGFPVSIPQGTQITTGAIDYLGTENFSTQYGLPFLTRTVVASTDSTNVLGGLVWESGHDTTWTTATVTTYYDAASDDTLKDN